MKVVVYVCGKRTGHFTKDGVELIVVYATRLTRSEAQLVCNQNPGTEVIKMKVTKD